MKNNVLSQIPKSQEWINVLPIFDGWSKDEKFYITAKNGSEYMLKLSDLSLFEQRKEQFSLLQKVEKLEINATKPIEIGVVDDKVYMLLSWIKGESARKVIKIYSLDLQYKLGRQAGEIMKKLHTIPIIPPEKSWYEIFTTKLQRKINNLDNCPPLKNRDLLIKYVTENAYLLKNVPILFQHGDFHVGNMVIEGDSLSIIDFDKAGRADPYDEFKPFCWTVFESPQFECGMIDSYFKDNIPEDFFPILALYAAESLIGHHHWAYKFGKNQVQVAENVNDAVMQWFDRFNKVKPKWYKE